MNAVVEFYSPLPELVRRAASHLAEAESAAEVLEAKELARAAYDAATSAARLAKLRNAHDQVVGAVYRAQADALEIEFRAKRRLADEYDAAKERGEVAGEGRPETIPGGNSIPTTADLGLSPKDILEGREVRAAEAAQPGIIRDIVDLAAAEHRQPTRAETRRAFREVVYGVGQRAPERSVGGDKDAALISPLLGLFKQAEDRIAKAGLDRLSDALIATDERLGGLFKLQTFRDTLSNLIEACDGD